MLNVAFVILGVSIEIRNNFTTHLSEWLIPTSIYVFTRIKIKIYEVVRAKTHLELCSFYFYHSLGAFLDGQVWIIYLILYRFC